MPVDDQMLLLHPSYLKHCSSGQLHFQVLLPSCLQRFHYPSSQTSQHSSLTKDHWHYLPTLCKHKTKIKKELMKTGAKNTHFLPEVFDVVMIGYKFTFSTSHLFSSVAAAKSALNCSKHLEEPISFPVM